MKKIVFVLLSFFISITVFPQKTKVPKPPFKVTKAQMYEDYDQFLHIVETYCPQIEVRMKTGYDMMGVLRARREMIEKIRNYWEFIQFMDGSVDAILDMHARRRVWFEGITHPRFAPGQSFYDSTGLAAISEGTRIYEKKRHVKGDRWLWMLGAKYIGGQYYCTNHFAFINKFDNDSICFQNARVIACDRQPADMYVRNRMFSELPASHILWDLKREKYFTDMLMVDYDNVLKVEEDEKNEFGYGKVYEFVPNHYGVKMQEPANKEIREKYEQYYERFKKWPSQFVTYFPEYKVLYIYTDQMRAWEDYHMADSIKKTGAGKTIEKIIVDVRYNPGGGDEFWYDMLSAIIRNPVCFEYNLALNGNNEVMAYLSAEFPTAMVDEYQKDTVNFLDNKVMWVSHGTDTIFPDSNSLGFDGRIYILQGMKTGSAAHSFTSVAWQVPQLVSIGVSTGQMAGFGLNPWGFQLKHSHYTFSFEPALDISGAKSWKETFHCMPEIELEPTLQDVNNEIFMYLLSPEEYLQKYDYLFKYILQLKD